MAMMSGGGYAGRRHSLVAPPPPFPGSSSSSSNLSPLAPPFVNPYSSPLAALQPPSSSQFLPAADWSSFVSVVPFHSDLGTDGVVSHPYFSQFYPDLPSAGAIGDGFENPSSAYSGVEFRPWKRSFDEDSGKGRVFDPQFSWMDSSSSYKVSAIQKGISPGNHSNFEADSHCIWHGKYPRSVSGEVHSGLEESVMLHENKKATTGQDSSSLYSISPATFLAPNSLCKGMSYSGLPRSSSDKDPFNSSGSNQSYDLPITQSDSCFAYSFTVNPPVTCPTSTQLHSPSDVMNDYRLRNSDAVVDYMNSYIADEVVSSPIKENNVKINEDSFRTGGNFAKNEEDFGIDKGSQEIDDHIQGLSSKKKSATENSMSLLSKSKSNLKLRGSTMNIDSPGNFSAEPEIFIANSSEALDQLNLVLDSPCWKGASTLQQAPISVAEKVLFESKAEFSDSNDLNQKNKLLEENLEAPISPDDTMFLEEINTSSSSENQESVSLLYVHQKFDNDNNVAKSATNGNTNHTFCSKFTNHMNEEMKFGKTETELLEDIASDGNMNDIFCSSNNTNHKNEEMEFTKSEIKPPELIASNRLQPAEEHSDPESGQSSSRAKMLIRKLYGASVDLLFADCSNDNTLDKHDLKLLWSAYNNMYLVLKDRQAFAWSGICAWMLPNAGVENEGLTQSTIRNIGKHTHFMDLNNKSDEADKFTYRFRDLAHRKFDVTTNAFEEHMAKYFSERDESSQTLLYKKLWAEAEAAKCKLKYDLQVARMKISETEVSKHQSRGKLAPSTMSSSPRSPHKLDIHDKPLKAKESLLDSSPPLRTQSGTNPCTDPPESFLAQQSNINSQEDLESSVMARFKILKDRKSEHNLSSINGEERDIDSEGVCSISKQIANLAVAEDDAIEASTEILPTYLTDLGFTESIVDPYAQEKLNSLSSLVVPRTDVQSHGARYMEIHEPELEASEIAESRQEILSSTKDQSMSNTGKNPRSWFHAVRYRSPSSEWEHV